jgi:hypothetical protein
MKRLSAIVLSLLLFWVQVFLVAQPVRAQATAKCACCRCNKGDCCAVKSPGDAAPLPAATVQTGSQNLSSFSLSASIAWMLPRGEADSSRADNTFSLPAARVPLFRRDCALLI